jgi:hypothetical protein
MPPVGFETTISAGERPQTDALDRAAGNCDRLCNIFRVMKFYRTLILCVGLYGCETWSFTLREERRLRVFENRVLGGIFGLRVKK